MCGASSSASSWARVASFWLALLFTLVQVPINGQSTTPGPRPQDGSNPQEMDFDSSLKEALSLIESTFPLLDEVRSEASAWKLDSQKWKNEATALSSELTKLRQDSEERLRLSEESLKQEKKLREAAEARQSADQEAIDQARTNQVVVGVVAFLAGAGMYAGAHFIGLVP